MAAVADIPFKEKTGLTHQIRKEIIISKQNLTSSNYNFLNYGDADLYDTMLNLKIKKAYTDFVEAPVIVLNKEAETKISDLSYNANFQQLQNKFEIEYLKYSHYISTDKSEAKEIFRKISKHISDINFNKIAIELTPSNAIKFTIILNNKLTLTISKPFGEMEDLEENQVVFSLYNNKELMVSDAAKINELVKGINSYVKV